MGHRSALFFDGIYLSGLLQLQQEFVSFRYYRGTWDKKKCFSFSDSCRYITTAVVNLFFGTLVSMGPEN